MKGADRPTLQAENGPEVRSILKIQNYPLYGKGMRTKT